MRVMIRVPNWVGDAVMAVPALRELRRIFAEADITLLARPWVSGLFDGEGIADSVIHITDARGPIGSAAGFVNIARRLRRERFDLAVLLQNAFQAAFMARVGGVRRVAGYPTDARRMFLDQVIPFLPDYKTRHHVSYYLNIAASLERDLTSESKVNLEAAEPTLNVSHDAREESWASLEQFGLGRQRPLLAINPGATNSRAKQWPAERFAGTADRLAERDGFQTIIVGAAGDIEAAEATLRLMRSPAVMLAGKTEISELKSVLACSALVISNDTGAAHVSAALGVPTVVVFGPTDHTATRPYSDLAAVVRHNVECSPCMLKECPIDHRCMTRVEVEDVYRTAKTLRVTQSAKR